MKLWKQYEDFIWDESLIDGKRIFRSNPIMYYLGFIVFFAGYLYESIK